MLASQNIKNIAFSDLNQKYHNSGLGKSVELVEVLAGVKPTKQEVVLFAQGAINSVVVFEYRADFTYDDSRGHHVVDIKSEATCKLPVFRLKKKILKALYGIDIEVVLGFGYGIKITPCKK